MRAPLLPAIVSLIAATAPAQHSSLIEDETLEAIIAESSGSLGLSHFRKLLAYSGFAPSLGSEQTADYIAARAREFGLEDVRIEEFPSDGQTFFWSFRTEPYWEARKGDLFLLDPKGTIRRMEVGFSKENLEAFLRDACAMAGTKSPGLFLPSDEVPPMQPG